MDAQKIFIASFMSKFKGSVSLLRIKEIYSAVSDNIKTDISIGDIIVFATQAFSVPSDMVRFVTLAGEGAVANASGASYYVISRPSAIEIVNEYLGANATEESFDKNRVFLNDKYDSFSRIYNSPAQYTVYDAKSLVAGQLDIARK